jgi:V8-like Glu-specific endopeptidase
MTGIANGGSLAQGSTTLEWTSNGCHYWAYAGTAPDKNEYHNQSLAGGTSVTISGYPSDGSDVHLTLLYRNTNIIGAAWKRAYFVFHAPQDTLCTTPPSMTSHHVGDTLLVTTDTLSWTSNGCHFWVYVGDAPNRNNYHNQSMAGATSVTISGYPADGSDVHLTLLYRNTNSVGAPWNREYFAFSAPGL